MYKKIWISATSIVSILALGVGATYALFTSVPVTLSANTLTTGLAEIRICKETAEGTWNTTATGFTVGGLVPGAAETELTTGVDVFLGNDDGTLATELGAGVCDAYTGAPGSSDIPLQMIPKISTLVCGDVSLETDMELRFLINGNSTGYETLAFWETNTTPIAQTFAPGQAFEVQIFTQLDTGATFQNTSCTFDMDFQGSQV